MDDVERRLDRAVMLSRAVVIPLLLVPAVWAAVYRIVASRSWPSEARFFAPIVMIAPALASVLAWKFGVEVRGLCRRGLAGSMMFGAWVMALCLAVAAIVLWFLAEDPMPLPWAGLLAAAGVVGRHVERSLDRAW